MQEGKPSQTAYRVALRRAAHQVFDDPIVFRDPLALHILGLDPLTLQAGDLRAPRRPFSRSLRAYLVARSCLAEDTLHAAVAQGCTQYVLLGAGLDTFAYRNPHPDLRVFEVDHPATQQWKRSLLFQNGIAVPESCIPVPVNFERDSLMQQLGAHGFDQHRPAVFAWLGVLPYLTREAMRATLHALPAATRLVLDYSLPRHLLPYNEQLALDSLSARVASAGEPFQQFFTPEEIGKELGEFGFRVVQDFAVADINARYFADRRDGLRILGTGAHLLLAGNVPGAQD